MPEPDETPTKPKPAASQPGCAIAVLILLAGLVWGGVSWGISAIRGPQWVSTGDALSRVEVNLGDCLTAYGLDINDATVTHAEHTKAGGWLSDVRLSDGSVFRVSSKHDTMTMPMNESANEMVDGDC